jgi:hypothetical protein
LARLLVGLDVLIRAMRSAPNNVSRRQPAALEVRKSRYHKAQSMRAGPDRALLLTPVQIIGTVQSAPDAGQRGVRVVAGDVTAGIFALDQRDCLELTFR